jgi:hypothetical protein
LSGVSAGFMLLDDEHIFAFGLRHLILMEK